MDRHNADVPMNLPSNSHTKRQPQTDKPEKVIEKVVAGKVIKKKKGLGNKFAETFLGDTVESVGDYIMRDIIIPAGLNMASSVVDEFLNIFRGGADMMLFGEQRSRHKYRTGGRTNYSKISSGVSSRISSPTRTSSVNRKALYQIDDIIMDNRGDAELVLDRMQDILEEYGFVSVSDLYEMVGERHTFADQKQGWSDLGNAAVRRGRDGYHIQLPRTRALD